MLFGLGSQDMVHPGADSPAALEIFPAVVFIDPTLAPSQHPEKAF
jgi:hypothetical protein